jgi:hypothetical protein
MAVDHCKKVALAWQGERGAPILKIWDYGRIGEWATGADDHGFNTKNIPGAETHTPTNFGSKFQLSRCYTGREIGHRQTDGRHNDFSRAHFLKMCSK